MIRLLLIAAAAVILSIGLERVCVEDTQAGEVICAPFESPVSPVRVVYREWLPVILK